LDEDKNGKLEGGELDALAKWVFFELYDKEGTPEEIDEQKQKTTNACDKNKNGSIDKTEFEKYFKLVGNQAYAFHKARA